MKKPKPHLTRHFKKNKGNNFLKLILLPSIGLVSIGLGFYGLQHLPWHWQLFIKWLFRQGDVTSIPEKFYPELNYLCYTQNGKGLVSSYEASQELAYSLGKFKCQLSEDKNYWIIHDTYTFSHPDEASPGSLLAIVLVSIVGVDYSYNIDAIIPILK
ncbi:conserved hypothetical protein [Gloeothece citriformis PCC 7424]|uniref:Uncharacterized protein n=1 Tax=Gloeothece citriformis (strain PCC 7424) TaxID=65393 RepID=B7KII1_GLOC7|nr:hypothetical protein [Gloeothece citriformis]ACK69387.1 conserved hypothetical protein [Gloeothece citriformis PCC 7424]